MELTTSWKEEGRAEGRAEGLREGLEEGLALALQARFGERAAALAARLRVVDEEAMERLKGLLLTAPWEKVEELLSRG